jgi:hypothetical protein
MRITEFRYEPAYIVEAKFDAVFPEIIEILN